MKHPPTLLLLLLPALLLFAARAATAAEAEAADAPPLSFAADAEPLVDFGAAATTNTTTTVDPETRALLEAFADAERQLLVVAADNEKNNKDDKEPSHAAIAPKLASLLSALRRTRAKVADELSDTLDEKIFDRASALRQRLGPEGQLRLIEEAQKARGTKCKAGTFTPPKMAPAKITGGGALLIGALPLCSLNRKAAPLQITLPIACTGAGMSLKTTPAIYSASTLVPAKATTRECKAERKWGPEGTAEVVLFDPKHLARQFGLLPPEKFNNTGAKKISDPWRDGAEDVKEAVKSMFWAMLGNTTVKDAPNGPFKEVDQEAVAAKFVKLRDKMRGLDKKKAAPNGTVVFVGKSDGEEEEGDAAAGTTSPRRREAEATLRRLAAEYVRERLGGGGEGAKRLGADWSARLASAMRDVAFSSAAESAPPGLLEVQR